MNNHLCISIYEYDTTRDWKSCPKCNLKPKIWEFDNGRATSCGCGVSKYDNFSIRAESIMSVYKRTSFTKDYNTEELFENWNRYCETEIVIELEKGRW